MLYDNVRYLGDVFHHFLLENPELFHDRWIGPSVSQQVTVQSAEGPLRQRLQTWLDTATTLTDPTHRATLLQLADTYEALLQLPDTTKMYHNRVALSPLQEDIRDNGKSVVFGAFPA
jgi:hypothetical protein